MMRIQNCADRRNPEIRARANRRTKTDASNSALLNEAAALGIAPPYNVTLVALLTEDTKVGDIAEPLEQLRIKRVPDGYRVTIA